MSYERISGLGFDFGASKPRTPKMPTTRRKAMSYERINSLGADLKSFGPGGKTGIDRTPAPSQSTPSINKAGTPTSNRRLTSGVAPKKISVPTGSSTPMPPIPRGYIRVPIAERPGLKIWDVRLNGLAKVKMQLDRDPNYTSIYPGRLERFRKAKHRAELIAASQGVMCLSGSQMGSATGTLDWWRQCDREAWACWHPDAMMPVKYDLKSCVSAPTILLNYWVADRAFRGGSVPCPTGTIKDNLFGFAALASESSGRKAPGVGKVADAAANAAKKEIAADAASGKIKDTKYDLSRLSNAKDVAQSTGAPPEEVTALQKQINQLTNTLAKAQQEHIAAAQAAADAHRQEMAVLQDQMNAIANAAQSAQSTGSHGEAAALQAQAESLQEQIVEAEAAAVVEEQAADTTAAEAIEVQPWYDEYRTHLYVGGGLLVIGAAYYYFVMRKTAMNLPAPTSIESPSGLAENSRWNP